MMKRLCFAFVLMLVAFMSAIPAKAADAVTPTSIVRGFYDNLIDTMKHGEKLGFDGRYKKLEPIVSGAFNLPLMTRVAVGLAWSSANTEERRRLISAFSDFSIASYADRFASYDGEKFEVVGENPASNGGVIVETRLTPKDGEPVALNYLVRADETGAQRIVDVFIDATISELATRRSEFTAIVKRDGIDGLVATLGEKTKKMGG